MRQRAGLSVRRPVSAAGRVDRAAAHLGCGQDILLSASSAPEHQQGARPLRVRGPRARDTVDVARRPAQCSGIPTLVPNQKGKPQAAKRTDTVQRLPIPEPLLVRLHSTIGYRRGDNAITDQNVEGAHGHGDGEGSGGKERNPRFV